MKKIRGIYGLSSIISLVIGMFIYFLFRDLNKMILFLWMPKPAFFGTVLIQLRPSFFSRILLYNLPDMFWFLSAILFLRFIWFYKIRIQKIYISCFYAIGTILEISQLSEKVPGTFDFLDLLFMGISASFEGLLYKICFVRRQGWKTKKTAYCILLQELHLLF